MNWLTPQQVREAATTPEKALDVSILHWEQIVAASKKELRQWGTELLSTSYCGMCRFYRKSWSCKTCLIESCGAETSYGLAFEAFADYSRNYTDYNAYRRFKYHAKKMLKLLRELKQKGIK